MLKKSLFLSIVLLSIALSAVQIGPEYKTITTEEKCKEKGLLFLASFDKYNVNADFAHGEKLALTCPDISLLLRCQYGFDGAQAYKPDRTEELVYSLPGNLLPEQGTLSVWCRIDDFEPNDQTISNASVYRIFVRNSESWTENFAYITKGTLYFCNHCGTGMMPDFGSFGTNVKLDKIKKGQWFQVSTTWNSQTASFYLNGEKVGSGPAPKPIQPGPGSFIGLCCRIWWQIGLDTRQHLLSLDDLKVYDQTMSDIQIAKKYNDLLKNPSKLSNLIILKASGKDRGPGKVPALRVTIDARALDNETAVNYQIAGPGLKKTGTIPLQNGTAELLFDVPAAGGEYSLNAQCGESSETINVNVPDCSFALQPEEPLTIPYPWTAPVLNEKERSISVWNRKYVFGSSPFPQHVFAGGEELLQKPPVLLAEKTPVKWSAGKIEKTDLGFILYGTGSSGKLTFN